ncbi:hypothetical protein [Flavobacterium hydrophilum]|uniref:DUF3300 domain-containing protein n=1 Tax=Flavobacterium hydrophilum TaxID=2211445 RepID=A0A2V4C780_9FLAO|nr:hypothetical protein [Flavobacterium hydrophilum]PXY45953.1 hypothetical protein DMB68_01820 [Flavobacterium hydrophilum]
MKAKILFLALVTIGLSSCAVQSQTTVYAKNSDISDNLDLRAVASIFGESANLQDFERRLNDPKYQISNLDLNNDDQVDYLRVIETVEDRTHVVIIQSVLDRDVYQDIATIDVERDNYNKVSVQIVGNSYLYGANYIYEPVYNVSPVIYSSFWVTNYRPYYSTWTWNFFPTYYVAWRPYPIYRYRSNINICINVNNRYNYVNHRRSYRAPVIYETRRSYGYERQYPNRSFSQRHANVNNRYELDRRRVASRESSRNQNVYNNNRSNSGRSSGTGYGTPNRNYAENRNASSNRSYNSNRAGSDRDNTSKANNPVRVENNSRTESRGYSNENRTNGSRENSENKMNENRSVYSPRTESRGNSENRTNETRSVSTPRTESSRGNFENRINMNRAASSSTRTESQRTASENRSSRPQASQRSEAPRGNQEARGGGQSQRQNNSESRGGGRRG